MLFNKRFDFTLWQKIQYKLADSTGAYVYTLDNQGKKITSAGKPSEFYKLVKEKDTYKNWQKAVLQKLGDEVLQEYDPAGLLNIVLPIKSNNVLLGCCIISSLLVDNDKLKPVEGIEFKDNAMLHDENKINAYTTLLRLVSSVILPIVMEHNESKLQAHELNLVLDYLNQISFVLDQERLIQLSISFFVRKLNLSNCSIHLNKKVYRYHDNETLTSLYEQVESTASAHVRNTNSLLVVSAMEKDFFFENIENVRQLPPSLFAAPIPNGFLFLYSENNLRNLMSEISILTEKLSKALEKTGQYKTAQNSAVTDPLTGIYNRAYFMAALDAELARALQQNKSTSVVIFDIDDFKKYNDTYGHLEGDHILKDVSRIAKESIEVADTLCRYGGEEFVLIFPEAKPEEAYQKADKIRRMIEQKTDLTISVGLVTCLNSSANPSEMLKESDKAMYKAKNAGKNRTINFIIVDKSLGVIDAQEASRIGKS